MAIIALSKIVIHITDFRKFQSFFFFETKKKIPTFCSQIDMYEKSKISLSQNFKHVPILRSF